MVGDKLAVQIGGEFLLSRRQGFVGDRDHAVDLVVRDHERRGEVDGVPDARQQTVLVHQLGDALGELMLATELLLGFLVLDDLDAAHQAEATHVADGRV